MPPVIYVQAGYKLWDRVTSCQQAIGLLDVRGLTKWANIVFEKLARETACLTKA